MVHFQTSLIEIDEPNNSVSVLHRFLQFFLLFIQNNSEVITRDSSWVDFR